MNSSTRNSQNIVTIGDRHVRNCATKLQHNLGANYEVSNIIIPGAKMDATVNTARDPIKKLRSEDVVVVWEGSNGITKNNAKVAIKHVCNFVEVKKRVNIVIIKSSHRHDLILSSCVNNEVLNFNKQVEKKMKIYNDVKMLETDFDRKYFAKHGQHMNLSGKKLISITLTTVIKKFFTKKQLYPTCLQWKDSISEGLKYRLSKTGVRVVHPEFPDQNNLD